MSARPAARRRRGVDHSLAKTRGPWDRTGVRVPRPRTRAALVNLAKFAAKFASLSAKICPATRRKGIRTGCAVVRRRLVFLGSARLRRAKDRFVDGDAVVGGLRREWPPDRIRRPGGRGQVRGR